VKIVPAIDLKNGKVVRAVAGQRKTYRPLESRLVEGAQPAAVGCALVDRLGFQQGYVADLDAIAGDEPAWDIFVALMNCGLSVWVDAGLSDKARIERMVEFADDHKAVNGIIAGLESLPDEDAMVGGLDLAGPERFIFGLDLRDGRPMTESPAWYEMIAPEIAAQAVAVGVKRILVVDVATVGMHGGCATDKLCRHLHHKFPEVRFYTGGGIRHVDDLHALARHGCSAAIVCSALHDGWIDGEDLADFDHP
jgi:phosphoribosylformimino-5-aminoimidazole carboxamide ribotide isomerase